MVNQGSNSFPTQRNGTVDVMRLIASAGIVWFHAHAWGYMVSYSALSLFIVFMIVLPLQRPFLGSFPNYIWERADRLLRPWLIWSGIFAVLKISQAFVENRPLTSEFDWSMLVMGTQAHLWFLPFGFVCSVAAFAVSRFASRTSRLAFQIAVLLAALSTPASVLAQNSGLSSPWAEWGYGLSAVLFGMAIYFANFDQRRLGIVALVTLGSWAATASVLTPQAGAASMVFGVNLAILALSVKFKSRPWTRWAAAVSMPVYLSHPIFIAVLQGKPAYENTVVLAIAAIVLSLAFGTAVVKLGLAQKLL